MLVLTRRPNQVLKIGDDIEITILNIYRNQIRIGVTAPKDVTIMREEAIVKKEKTA